MKNHLKNMKNEIGTQYGQDRQTCINLENDLIKRTMVVNNIGMPILEKLVNKETGFNWALGNRKCNRFVKVNEELQTSLMGENWHIENTMTNTLANGSTELAVTMAHSSGTMVTQFTTCFPGTAVIQHRCRVENKGTQPFYGLVSFDPLNFTIAHPDDLHVHTIRRDRYCLNSQLLNKELVIRGGNWNRPENAGWIVLENKKEKEYLYIGVEWEREWEISINPVGKGVEISFSVVRYSKNLYPGEAVDSPAIFVGLAHGDLDIAVNKIHEYLCKYVFPPIHENFPWTAYDIWSTDSECVEDIILEELDFAAELGIEVFYIDAAWWAGSSIKGQGAWGLGLGNYEEDLRKFPNGLKYISDRVHKKGLKFGLWVDPMIIDEQWLTSGKIPDRWLVKQDGIISSLDLKLNDWPKVIQICTGCPEVKEYLLEMLSNLVERYSLDWLKWDDSAFAQPFCNRSDHGHQSGDGNYEALKGKYEICEELIHRFPNLVIEQCGYPARLDYGLARYIRSNWLSDASSPAKHVRGNMEIASYIYPASYNTAWIIQDKEILEESDPMKLDTIVRSRMMGLFGLGTLNGQLSERASLWPLPVIEAIKRNLVHYKQFRHLLSQDVYHLSPFQEDEKNWQVISFVARGKEEAVVFCFRGNSENSEVNIKLRGLSIEKDYIIRSLNTYSEVKINGRTLMEKGLVVKLEHPDMSEILLLKCK
ncbi:MAG: alpha-galactosidase [Clostridiaceae bacterium]|nr:alpha-galactosidase [Clostridiaceae bacterium]